jgi:hypothetical protein
MYDDRLKVQDGTERRNNALKEIRKIYQSKKMLVMICSQLMLLVLMSQYLKKMRVFGN